MSLLSNFSRIKSAVTLAAAKLKSEQLRSLVILIGLLLSGLLASLHLITLTQDLRQKATSVSCSNLSKNECQSFSSVGCSWHPKSCSQFSTESECGSGCSWQSELLDCSSLNTQAECNSHQPSGCHWERDIRQCSIDQGCDQEGCSLQTRQTVHNCSLGDNNCSQGSCDYQAGYCEGSYTTTGQGTCSGSHVCEGTAPCSSYTSSSSCYDHCCSWDTPTVTLSCNGLSEGSCNEDGCTWHPPTCSGVYQTNEYVCVGSYQATTGSCKGGVVETGGFCTGSYHGDQGSCTGTIQVPTSTPTPTSLPTPTTPPNQPAKPPTSPPTISQSITPTQTPVISVCYHGYSFCPSGTIPASGCSNCQSGACCKQIQSSPTPTGSSNPSISPTNPVNQPTSTIAPTQTPFTGTCYYGTSSCPTGKKLITNSSCSNCPTGSAICCEEDATNSTEGGICGVNKTYQDGACKLNNYQPCSDHNDCLSGYCHYVCQPADFSTKVLNISLTPTPVCSGGDCLWAELGASTLMQTNSKLIEACEQSGFSYHFCQNLRASGCGPLTIYNGFCWLTGNCPEVTSVLEVYDPSNQGSGYTYIIRGREERIDLRSTGTNINENQEAAKIISKYLTSSGGSQNGEYYISRIYDITDLSKEDQAEMLSSFLPDDMPPNHTKVLAAGVKVDGVNHMTSVREVYEDERGDVWLITTDSFFNCDGDNDGNAGGAAECKFLLYSSEEKSEVEVTDFFSISYVPDGPEAE